MFKILNRRSNTFLMQIFGENILAQNNAEIEVGFHFDVKPEDPVKRCQALSENKPCRHPLPMTLVAGCLGT